MSFFPILIVFHWRSLFRSIEICHIYLWNVQTMIKSPAMHQHVWRITETATIKERSKRHFLIWSGQKSSKQVSLKFKWFKKQTKTIRKNPPSNIFEILMTKNCHLGPSATEHHMKALDRDTLVNSASPHNLNFLKVSPFSGLN